ncbi:ATP-binding SpoIIE family protein phosphatase [Blastococcus saxobsidens]|uniref:Two component signal transduction histidine kinase n=1 Tax=Blastococcus saxobsidens (strain DD2) TaxID=1146883 RepID=H6RKU9_BLASD|nr:ATP-binding SpoIIE family protein phosphatase [Blastococcus saxobsidens]CCG03715.1 Two component signal transduction histidine kinase [Blastococcus saxobsidens DD2]
MTEALWACLPRPEHGPPARAVVDGRPTTLAELRSLRLRLRASLDDGGLPPGAAEDDLERLLLVFEELVSNGLRHGGAPVQVVVTDTGTGWLIEVGDATGDVPPVPAVGRDAALGGLGLYLVAQIAGAHGWTADGDGRKVVWARADFTGETGSAAAPVATSPAPVTAAPVGAAAPVSPSGAGPRVTRGAGTAPDRRRRSRSLPRRLSVAVAVVVLLLTLGLAWVTSAVNASNNERLLEQQIAEIATLLSAQVAVLQTQMADAGQVAAATAGEPGPFTRFAAATVSPPELSLSLWRVSGNQVEQVAVHGPAPLLAGDEATSFFTGLEPAGQLSVAGILDGPEPRLAYALRPGNTGGLVVHAEVPLNRRVSVPAGDAYSGLDLAVFLGRTTSPEQLVQTTAPLPIEGDTATRRVPFGDGELTVVAASRSSLTGPLSAALPWIVLGVGGALAVGGGTIVEILSRRRAVAERLAADNAELYRRQRGIAGTLQHALLPEVPRVEGLELAARYVAGADELEVGGDWYDVIPGPAGRWVFVVGDISGQGLPAATTMASLRFAVRAYVAQGDDIATVMHKLGGLLDVHVDHQFATVLLGELDPAEGVVRIASAGHFPPLLISGSRAEYLDCRVGPPVGVATDVPAVTETRVAGPATLLAFTDGAVERRGEDVDTGLERLRTAAVAAVGRPLPAVLDRLMQLPIDDGGRDDTVILALRWGS